MCCGSSCGRSAASPSSMWQASSTLQPAGTPSRGPGMSCTRPVSTWASSTCAITVRARTRDVQGAVSLPSPAMLALHVLHAGVPDEEARGIREHARAWFQLPVRCGLWRSMPPCACSSCLAEHSASFARCWKRRHAERRLVRLYGAVASGNAWKVIMRTRVTIIGACPQEEVKKEISISPERHFR